MKINRRHMVIWPLAIMATLFLLAAAGMWFILPAYIENRIVSQLESAIGLSAQQAKVRRIGLWGADLGPIRFGKDQAPAIAVSAIQINYSPMSLIRGEITGITIGGAHLRLASENGRITIAGMASRSQTAGRSDSPPIALDRLLPVPIQWLRFEQATITVRWNDRTYTIPMDMTMDTAAIQHGRISAEMRLDVLGNTIDATVDVDQAKNAATFAFESRAMYLESVALSGALPPTVHMRGTAMVKGTAAISIAPLAITSYRLDARLKDAMIDAGAAQLRSMDGIDPSAPPIELYAQGNSMDAVQWSMTAMQVRTPTAHTNIRAVKGVARKGDTGWIVSAEAGATVPAQTFLPEVQLVDALPITIKMDARQLNGDTVAGDATVDGTQPVAGRVEGAALKIDGFEATMTGRMENGAIALRSDAVARALTFADPDADLNGRAKQLVAKGTLQIPSSAADKGPAFAFDTQLDAVRIKSGSMRANVPRIVVTASGQHAKKLNRWAATGTVQTANAAIRDPQRKLQVDGVAADIPLVWPTTQSGRPGRLSINNVRWGKRDLGGIAGRLQQKKGALVANLRHTSKLFSGMTVTINSTLNADGLKGDIGLATYSVEPPLQLGDFTAAASGFEVSGQLSASADIRVDRSGPHATGSLRFENGAIRQPESQLALEGITLEMDMDDLITMQSRPKQHLQIDTLQLGKLSANALEVDFQVEKGQTVFVEKAAIKWCNGHINAAAIRISPGIDDYDLTLFCDRLNLAMVLEQVGAAEARGEGTVNGRIPVQWSNGRIRFDNGFLYSTPGQSGEIQLSGTEALLAGLPPGTPQHTQLDIATEALKDYTYQWAKLFVSSDAENLLLALKLDGKPNRLLPFAYDQALGQFKRVAGKGQADFKGISIDLNFTSPLNDIIHYKELLRKP